MKKYFVPMVLALAFLIPSGVFAQVATVSQACLVLDAQGSLKYGATDTSTKGQVTLLQTFLQNKGFLAKTTTTYISFGKGYNQITVPVVKGTFGPLTVAAVKAFQRAYNLTQTGVIDVPTSGQIQSIVGSCARLDLPTNTAIVGSNVLYRYQIAAPLSNSVTINQQTFDIKTSGVTLGSNLSLYAYKDQNFTQPVDGYLNGQLQSPAAVHDVYGSTESKPTTFVISSSASGPLMPLVIPAGQVRYIQLVGNIATIASGAYGVTTSLTNVGDATLFVGTVPLPPTPATPTISNITTPVNATDTVTITGTNFAAGDTILVDGTNPYTVTPQNSTTITFVPSTLDARGFGIAPGTHTISVQTPRSTGIVNTNTIVRSNTVTLVVNAFQSTITVTSPKGGETWQVGGTYNVSWQPIQTGNVSIYLEKPDNSGCFLTTVPSASGSTNVQISLQNCQNATNVFGSSILPGQYKLGLTYSVNGIWKSVSDSNYFNIIVATQPSITVTSPNGGDVWQKGNSYTVTWNNQGLDPNLPAGITLTDYSGGSGAAYGITDYVTAGGPKIGAGRYTILLGTTGASNVAPVGSKYKISVSTPSGLFGTVTGQPIPVLAESSGYFTITAPVPVPTNLNAVCSTDGTQATFSWTLPTPVNIYGLSWKDNNGIQQYYQAQGSSYTVPVASGVATTWKVAAVGVNSANVARYSDYVVGSPVTCTKVVSTPATPTISNITTPVNATDTVTITGTNFAAGDTILVDGTRPYNVTPQNSTTITFVPSTIDNGSTGITPGTHTISVQTPRSTGIVNTNTIVRSNTVTLVVNAPAVVSDVTVPVTTIATPPLSAPRNLGATCSADGTQATFSWTLPDAATQYALYWKDSNNNQQYRQAPKNSSYTVPVISGMTYTWRIASINVVGNAIVFSGYESGRPITCTKTALTASVFGAVDNWKAGVANTNTVTAPSATQNVSACLNLARNIQYRDNDALNAGAISQLQSFLQTKGYLNSNSTGYFGDQTFQAVKAFQAAGGIEATGYVGALTRAKIQEVSCN